MADFAMGDLFGAAPLAPPSPAKPSPEISDRDESPAGADGLGKGSRVRYSRAFLNGMPKAQAAELGAKRGAIDSTWPLTTGKVLVHVTWDDGTGSSVVTDNLRAQEGERV